MPEIPHRQNPGHEDPFEDDGTGYIDPRPGITVGSADFRMLYDLTKAEIIDYIECQQARRRVPIGFQLPAKRGVRRGRRRPN